MANKPLDQLTEEELMERAVAMSLITEQEDEKRRQQMYGTIKKPQASSLISRPRPQPRVGSDNVSATIQRPPSSPRTSRVHPPVVPPRPPSGHQQLPQHTCIASMQRPDMDPKVPPRPVSRQRESITPNKDHTPPLISFSPSLMPKKNELFDFDISSLDPLNAPSTSRPPQEQDMFSTRLNQQTTGFGSQVFTTTASSISNVHTSQSGSGTTRSAPASPKKQLSLAPAPPPLAVPSHSERSITPTPSPNPLTRVANDPFFLASSNQNFHKVPSDPNFSLSYRSSQSSLAIDYGQVNGSGSTPNVMARVSPRSSTEILPSPPDSMDGAGAAGGWGAVGLAGPGAEPSAGDLMDFPENYLADQLLSLESFDPLFVSNMAQAEKLDSIGLFTNPYNKYERKDTPNPFPDINPDQTKAIMSRVSPEKIYRHYNTLDLKEEDESLTPTHTPSPEPSLGSGTSPEPPVLQDPFSMSQLTASLEQKRQRYAEEQEHRRKLLRVKPQPPSSQASTASSPDDTMATDTRVKKRRMPIILSEETAYECLQRHEDTAIDEIKAFVDMVARLKVQCPHTSEDNLGLIIASRLQYPPYMSGMTVKVIVNARFLTEPYTFTPGLSTSVQHMVCEVLLSVADDLYSTSADDYMLKVHGKEEYFLNESQLGEYAYIQQCLKLDVDILLTLIDFPKLHRNLIRTTADDSSAVYVPKPLIDGQTMVNRDTLNILMETYYKEVEKLRDAAIKDGCRRLHTKGVEGSVLAIMDVLFRIETVHLCRALQRLRGVGKDPGASTSPNPPGSSRNSFVYVSDEGEVMTSVVVGRRRLSDSYAPLDDLHLALEELTRGVKGLVEMYCRAFHTDFRFESSTKFHDDVRCVNEVQENFIVHIDSAHRIPLKMRGMFEEFRVVCGVYYGWRLLAPEITTRTPSSFAEGFHDSGQSVIWDEWITFETLMVGSLPREAQLVLQLIGTRSVQSNDGHMRVNTSLGTIAMQIFNHKFELVQGSQLVGLWPGNTAHTSGTNISNTDSPSSILMQINMPVFDFSVVFDQITDPVVNEHLEFTTIHPNEQEQLNHLLEKDCVTRLSLEEKEYLWSRRHYLSQFPQALSKVLAGAPSWEWNMLRFIYPLVDEWEPLPPLMALQLLLPRCADTFVRGQAVMWLGTLPTDELITFLPQLVQALKYESYHTSPLAQLLLQRAIRSSRLAHQLYWLLKEAANDVHYQKRYQLLFGALLSVVGENMRKEFSHQEDFSKMLASIAEKVKAAKEKENVLDRELENMWEFLQHEAVRLPLSPAMLVTGVDVRSSSYFSSNAFPLKLVLRNFDPKAEPIYVMFKSGDDLRQDMLTMQMIGIMDKLWLQGGLDLKIITFSCLSTGVRKGLVELVTESETLRKIQVKYGHGLTGSFKDNTIQKWLTVQNPTELEYEKAVSNFTASCAGYCVATYMLGICDRHNDNIMVKQSGHLFHIDFGKFLGDAQMFGNIKRDRSAFVLTSDMAYVINAGDKPSHRFQHFVDLCCQAFNILRRHANLFLSLFSLMLHSGIPGVTENACRYVQQALMPHCTDAEATVAFTRMIEDSLKSTFTQFNFFIHNLAQMRFSGHQEGALLSFIPKTYSIEQDGRIANVELYGFQKRYNPEKYYLYILKVDREGQKVPSFIFRRYSEFQELQHKLTIQFPLIRFPSLSNRVLLGRTHVKSVAEERKSEVDDFTKFLFKLAPEVSQHDLVYTFFHPMLRDEQDIDKTNLQKLKDTTPPRPQARTIEGQIKLCIFYKQDALTVMVMHVKDLAGLVGDPPDPYVKLYLLPDPMKITKRKTKIIKATFHPTFNEMLTFSLPHSQVVLRHLQVSVWGADSLRENEFLGAVVLCLRDLDLSKETTAWFPLRNYPNISRT